MFGNQDLTIRTKIAVYYAVVISTILHGCETWVPYHRHISLLESFHIRHLQLILGLRWWHKVTHSEIRSWAGIPSITSMLQCSAQLRNLFINAHFVADNASHALASSATAKPTFNIEEEVVVIRDGRTPKKKT